MKNRLFICLLFVCFISHTTPLPAQQVLYSPLMNDQSNEGFDVIGKAGNFYWIEKTKKKNRLKRSLSRVVNNSDINFEIYDTRMHLVKTIHTSVDSDVLKKYFIAGDDYFDELTFIKNKGETTVLLKRLTPEGNMVGNDTLCHFPGNMKGEDFLLVRSKNKNKILLLGFERVKDAAPNMHAILYNKNWNLLHQSVYKDRNITQPYVQYDFINYPLEHFNSSPVKLANSGEWLMLSPSALNGNYLLFNFSAPDNNVFYTKVKIPESSAIEDLSLSLNNETMEAEAGILLSSHSSSIKNVIVLHYIMAQCRFNFDTAYRFNTLAGNKTKDKNLFKEYFMPVPGKGFIFLKEYGRQWLQISTEQEVKSDYVKNDYSLPEQSKLISNNPIPGAINKNDYTRYNNLAGTRNEFDRGDLSFYFFPSTQNDSCWSGIVNKEQTNELNSPYLSYVLMTAENKLVFLYNSLFNDDVKYSSTTMLDEKGNPLNEGLVFWKSDNALDFQKARQISVNELAIPYEKNMRKGFAIVRL